MMKREGKLYIEDIINSIDNISGYIKGLSHEDFSKNNMVIDAVIRNLEIIGEASKNIPLEIKSLYPDIPWKEMAGMRDKVIHEYFGVDIDIVWATIIKRLPELKILLSAIKT
jgi:uncharacterized protein with HEPN domain